MKKLKIILPLLLISLFFIPKVNASVVNTYTRVKYSESNLALQEQYSDEIDLIVDYVKQNGIGNISYSSGGQYAISIRTDQLASNNFTVLLFKFRGGTGDFFNIYKPNDLSGSYVYMYISVVSQSMSIVNGSVVPIGSSSGYNSHFQWNYDNSCDPRSTDCIIYDNTHYFAYDYLDDNIMMPLSNITYNNPANIGIKILGNGHTEYNFGTGDSVSLYSFLQSMSDFDVEPPYTCDLEYLGNFTNVSSVTFRVQGTTNALAEPLQGNVVLTSLGLDWNNFNGNISDIVVQTNEGPNFEEYLVEHHDIFYSDGKFYFYYNVTSEDDIDTYIDILYTITWNNLAWEDFFKNNVEIRACQPYHGTFTYAYRDNTTGITNSSDTGLMNFLNNASVPTIKPISDLIRDYPAGPVDSILTMPLTILQAISNKINSNTCTPLTLPIPFVGGNLYLPCINTLYNSINGLNTFITWASSVIGALMLYKYFIFLFKWFDSITSFRDKFNFGGY